MPCMRVLPFLCYNLCHWRDVRGGPDQRACTARKWSVGWVSYVYTYLIFLFHYRIAQVSKELRPCAKDTALHIATRLRQQSVLQWLKTKPGLRTGVRNDEGLTAAETAVDLGPTWVETYERVFGEGRILPPI
jgi:hypothetical protein